MIYNVKSHALGYINMLILLKIILITIINTNFAMFINSLFNGLFLIVIIFKLCWVVFR